MDTAIVLAGFSPRLSQRRQPKKFGFSLDLWLFLRLSPGVSAGGSTQFNVDSAGFRANRRSRKLSSAVYNLRSACRNIDSPDTPEDHPDGQPPEDPSSQGDDDWDFNTDSFLFQFFAFGCLPSNMVCAFLEGISLQEAIDQISIDAIVPIHDESGVFIPAKGVPFRESVTLLWLPDWLVASHNYLLFVDVSMLGKYSFVIQYHGFAFSYADIAEQLSPIWEEELDHIYIFVPFFSLEPMQEETRYPASNGLTVVLQRDAMAPACIPDPAEAFRSYNIWGMDVNDMDQPPADLQWPVEKVQMTIDGDTSLFSIGSLVPTQQVMSGLARRFVHGINERQVALASFVPERHVWFGEPVCQLTAVLTTPCPPGTVCIFLVLRGIGRESKAVWLQQRDLAQRQFLAAVGLDIPFIPGFKIRVTGGERMHGRMMCRDGDVFFLNFVPDNGETEESESESETSDYDTDTLAPSGKPAPSGSAGSANGAGSGRRTSDNPPAGTSLMEVPQRDTDEMGHDTLLDMWNLDVSVSSAIRVGNRGDTSAHNAALRSILDNQRGPSRHSRRSAQGRPSNGTTTTSGIKLFVAGVAFLQNVVSGMSVLLPLTESCMSAGHLREDGYTSEPRGSVRGEPAAGDIFSIQHKASCARPCETWHFLPTFAAEDALQPDEQPLLTLLDQAKDDDFHCLCGELVWFFKDMQRKRSRECNVFATVSNLSVHSQPSDVQCTGHSDPHLACQMLQTEEPTEQPSFQSFATGRVVLELQTVVPPPCHVPQDHQSWLSCGVDHDMIELLLEGHRLDQLRQALVPSPDMHEHAQTALRTTPFWNRVDAFSGVALFTDGSFKEGHELVAHSVVGLVQVNEQWQLAGFISGAVDTSDPELSVPANAHVAELCGMIHARLIHLTVEGRIPLEICYDCMSASQVMRLGSPKGSSIDHLVASVEAICFLRGLQPTWTHVVGHSGHPWNEVADHLARRQLNAVACGHELQMTWFRVCSVRVI